MTKPLKTPKQARLAHYMLRVRMTAEDLAILDAQAMASGRDRSHHVRELLRERHADVMARAVAMKAPQ